MKHFVWIPLAVLAGFGLGGWAPRLEARRQELLVRDLRRQLAAAGGPRSALETVSNILPLNGPARRPASIPGPASPAPESAPDAAPAGPPPAGGEAEIRGPPASLREAIDSAAQIWKVRADLARSALLERSDFNADDAARFDVLMAGMNVRLRDICARWADRLRNDDEPFTPETGVRMAHEFTGALSTTYDEMDRNLPPAWRTAGETPVDLVDFVDPAVAEPLIAVEDRLDAGLQRGRERRRRW